LIDYFIKSLPILAALLVYFVRLEVKLAEIRTDLTWIKKFIRSCQQPSDHDTA